MLLCVISDLQIAKNSFISNSNINYFWGMIIMATAKKSKSAKKSVKKATKKANAKTNVKASAKQNKLKAQSKAEQINNAAQAQQEAALATQNPSPPPAVAERLYQMNVGYDAAEDRLILRTSTTANREFLFLITNRMFKQILELSKKIEDVSLAPSMASYQPQEERKKEVVREFHRQETLKKADFTSQYAAEEVTLTPVFDEPMLLVKIEVQINGDMLKVGFIGKNKVRTVFPMTKENFTALRHIIHQGAMQAGWIAPPSQDQHNIIIETPDGTVH